MASENKRYFFLKLPEDFFRCKEIKKLRKIAGGDTHVIIALKILLLGLKNDNRIFFDGVEEDLADELALEIDEDETNVKMVMHYLFSIGWLEQENENTLYSPKAAELTDSITDSAKRMRKLRENRQKQIPENSSASQCDTDVTPKLQKCDVEIEIEKEIDIDNSLRSLSCPSPLQKRDEPSISFPILGGKEAEIPMSWVDNMQKVFTAIDCLKEIEKAKAWCMGNQMKSNWKKFLYNWFKREHDRATSCSWKSGAQKPQRGGQAGFEETRYSNEAVKVEL